MPAVILKVAHPSDHDRLMRLLEGETRILVPVTLPRDSAALCITDTRHLAEEAPFFKHFHARNPFACVTLLANERDAEPALEALRSGRVDRILWEQESVEQHRTTLTGCLERTSQETRFHGAVSSSLNGRLFITGASGFLGRAVTERVLRYTDASVTLLVRDSHQLPLKSRFSGWIDDYPGRVEIVGGDITQPLAGLAPEDLRRVVQETDEIWHFAADTRFDEVLRGHLFETNLQGTRNVADLASACVRLRRFVHCSTAFVAGCAGDSVPVTETVASRPARFNNAYEESKYEAELAVIQSGLPCLIFRPGIIMGDVLSGRNDGKTVYNVAKMVRMAKFLEERERVSGTQTHPLRVIARAETGKNLIPVNIVASWMLRIAAKFPESGAIFHLTHPKPTQMKRLVQAIAETLAVSNYELVQDGSVRDPGPGERLLQRILMAYKPYMTRDDPLFERNNSETFLGDMVIPEMDHALLKHLIHSMFLMLHGPGYHLYNPASSENSAGMKRG